MLHLFTSRFPALALTIVFLFNLFFVPSLLWSQEVDQKSQNQKGQDSFEEKNPYQDFITGNLEVKKLKEKVKRLEKQVKFLKKYLVNLPSRKSQKDQPKESQSRITDKYIPLPLDNFPVRPVPLLEVGSPFLGTGSLGPEITLPFGEGTVWQPQLTVFGNLRSGLNYFRTGGVDNAHWANRLDIFANLQLNGFANERIVLGMRPFDESERKGGAPTNFTGYIFQPDGQEGYVDHAFNGYITVLFFEGDLGEMFPFLTGADDSRPLNIGFSVGRQPLIFQNGALINDIVDMVGIVKNNISLSGTSNLRVTATYLWSQLNRDNTPLDDDTRLRDDESASAVGLFSSLDFVPTKSTINIDMLYILDSNSNKSDAYHLGVSTTQRLFGFINSTFRVLTSLAINEQIEGSSTEGTLLTAEFSLSYGKSSVAPNSIYFNTFWGIDRYSMALRSPDVGGPLGALGILYAGTGLGSPPALNDQPDRAVGFALGHQQVWDNGRQQLIFEVAGRTETTDNRRGQGDFIPGQLAFGSRYQRAFGQNFIWIVDSFLRFQEGQNEVFGMRTEMTFRF